MSTETRSFPGKILLFGEYTILNGSSALAFPFSKYSGEWAVSKGVDQRLITWAEQLVSIKDLPADVDAFMADIDQGLIFDSSIKSGYGLGSSGALTAAFFHRYGLDIDDLDHRWLQKCMASAEAVFHGRSSGIDPLVSYWNHPVLFNKDKNVERVDLNIAGINAFLLDSGMPRETQLLVGTFRKKMADDQVFSRAIEELAVWQDQAIKTLLQEDNTGFWSAVRQISAYQWEHMRWLIPASIQPVFKSGLDSADYVLKFCGAGGGGYFLSFSSSGQYPSYKAIEPVIL